MALGLAAASCADVAGDERPGLIVISLDSVRRDHMSVYGYERDTTPALERLADEAIVFERAYTTVSWTLIAHMSLLTGLYPTQHGVWDMDRALAPSFPTLAERLADEGYATLGFYNPEWLAPRFGFGRGFDVYRAHADAAEASRNVAAALAERPARKPLFLFIHLYDAHTAPKRAEGWTLYDPPAPYDSMFVETARADLAEVDTHELWESQLPDPPERVRVAIEALYDGGIRYLDDVLGEWIEDWRAAGLLDRNWLVITADHGEGLAQHAGERYGGHGELYEEGLRVPLIVRPPGGLDAGERRTDAVSHVDLVPSVLAWLQLARDERLPGLDLSTPRSDERLIIAEDVDSEALLLGDWKVIQARGSQAGHAFDLGVDPGERNSVRRDRGLEDFLDFARPLRQRAAEERKRRFEPDGPKRLEPDPDIAERLEALGYGGDDH